MISEEETYVAEKKHEFNYEFDFYYEHTIDSKSRMFLPAKYREFVGPSAVLRMWEEGCLYLMTEDGWDEYKERAIEVLKDTEDRFVLRSLFSTATHVPLDSQGRILIPQKFMEYAGLTDKAIIVGCGKKAEIWDPARYEDMKVRNRDIDLIGILSRKGL